MTNHCTPRFFKALSNLEHNYPEVFATYSKLQLDDVASPLDPDFRTSKIFAMRSVRTTGASITAIMAWQLRSHRVCVDTWVSMRLPSISVWTLR